MSILLGPLSVGFAVGTPLLLAPALAIMSGTALAELEHQLRTFGGGALAALALRGPRKSKKEP